MTLFRKVSESCRTLRERGLLGADEAVRVAVVAGLLRTLEGSTSVVPEKALQAAPVREGELAAALGLPVAALRRQVERLRSLGFGIERIGGDGYRLARTFTDMLVAEAVLPLLLGKIDPDLPCMAGLPYRYRVRCASTNSALKKEAALSTAGTLVVTDAQTRGRGRQGRSWSSRPGDDLTFSVLLRPSLRPEQASLLSLSAALAVAEAFEALPGLSGRVRVKWPNDVLIDDGKVCGILLESSLEGERLDWVVAGVGVNVNSDPCALVGGLTSAARQEWLGKPRPTSLRVELGRKVARGALLSELLARLTERWAETDPVTLLDGLRARDALLGVEVEVSCAPPGDTVVMVGEGAGIGPAGELLVRDGSGRTVSLLAGEVTVRTAPPESG